VRLADFDFETQMVTALVISSCDVYLFTISISDVGTSLNFPKCDHY
jgi:hypothetical protein